MSKSSITCKWNGDMSFEGNVQGFKIILDSAEEFGGKNQGPRPKPLLLVALAGCTGMDVIPILKKMKVEPSYFNMKVEAEVSEEHPKVFQKIHIIYEFRGDNLPLDKLQKAVNLSQERYCAVSAMLKKAAPLTFEIQVLN